MYLLSGKFTVDGITPSPSGENAKVKVKVRVNIHGVFTVSSANYVEKVAEEEMETSPQSEQASSAGTRSSTIPTDTTQDTGQDTMDTETPNTTSEQVILHYGFD